MNEHRTKNFANLGHDFGSNMGKAIQESIEHQIDVLTESDWFKMKIRDAANDEFLKFLQEPEFESAVHNALSDWLKRVQTTVNLSLMDENNEKRKTRFKKREKLKNKNGNDLFKIDCFR